MSIHYQYLGILFLVHYDSIYGLVSIWCLYYALLQTLSPQVTLDVAIGTVFLHLSNFGLGLSFVADFSNTRARAPTSAECTFSFPAWRAMHFGHMVWIRILVFFHWLLFFLYPYKWIAVFSRLNNMILAIDQWSYSTQHLVKLAVDPTLDSFALHPAGCFPWFPMIKKKSGGTLNLLSFNLVNITY